jgi:TonB family protein
MRTMAIALACLCGAASATPSRAADTNPRLDISGINSQPTYPASALATREEGAIVVNVEVNDAGVPQRLLLLQSSGFIDLDRIGIAAILGWHFIPATENGKAVAGWAKEKIDFQPPDAPPPPSGGVEKVTPYLSAEFTLAAAHGGDATQEKLIPCANGSIQATLAVVNPKSAFRALPRAALVVRNESERVDLALENYEDSEKGFAMMNSIGQPEVSLSFDYITQSGVPVTGSLSWNPSGEVVADFGTGQRQRFRLTHPPTSFGFAARSATTKFQQPQLTCRPDAAVLP